MNETMLLKLNKVSFKWVECNQKKKEAIFQAVFKRAEEYNKFSENKQSFEMCKNASSK